jgi:hypothetical protein
MLGVREFGAQDWVWRVVIVWSYGIAGVVERWNPILRAVIAGVGQGSSPPSAQSLP